MVMRSVFQLLATTGGIEKSKISLLLLRIFLNCNYRNLVKFHCCGLLLRSFNLPFLRTVLSELLPEPEALERFNQLIRYPYIESRGNYRYAFHELLREALAEDVQKEEPEAWKRYHKRAFDYLNAAASRSPDWYYHL